jgi:hypothetical protein
MLEQRSLKQQNSTSPRCGSALRLVEPVVLVAMEFDHYASKQLLCDVVLVYPDLVDCLVGWTV